MNQAVVMAVARHLLTIAGGAMAARYDLGDQKDLIDALIGGGAALAGIVWSVLDKRGRG